MIFFYVYESALLYIKGSQYQATALIIDNCE